VETFPTIEQHIKSACKPIGKLITERSINGTLHGQFLLSESPYKINLIYVNLTTAQKNEIVDFYTTNKTEKFNFNFQTFDQNYICRFTKPPIVRMSKAPNKWDLKIDVTGFTQ